MKSKRGWMRLAESVIAVLILASVLIVVYTGSLSSSVSSGYITLLERKVLAEVAGNETLRAAAVEASPTSLTFLNSSVRAMIPLNLNFQLNICSFEALSSCELTAEVKDELFVENIFISGTITNYSPKVVRLYVWEK